MGCREAFYHQPYGNMNTPQKHMRGKPTTYTSSEPLKYHVKQSYSLNDDDHSISQLAEPKMIVTPTLTSLIPNKQFDLAQ